MRRNLSLAVAFLLALAMTLPLSLGAATSLAGETGGAGNTTWYLAEGCTDYGFDTFVIIENPNQTEARIRVTYMTEWGPVEMPEFDLDAMTTLGFEPYDEIGPADFSTKIECLSGQPIAVERWMSWLDNTGQMMEGHSSIGVTAPSEIWYLPEGSSKWGFECWVLVQNPNAADVTVDLTYMLEGAAPKTVKKMVPAESRRTFFMADDIGQADASVKVECGQPVIAERAMYRNGRREGHGSIGATEPSNEYYLAEGTTDWGFTTYVLVQNPNPEENQVIVTYMTESGAMREPLVTMPGNSRKTIRVNDRLPAADFSTQVQGTLPLLAERAMYWDSGLGETCHDSIGLDSPHMMFYVPGGASEPLDEARGIPDIETWTLVQNPNPEPVTVRVDYIDVGARADSQVPAYSRRTFCMSDYCGRGMVSSGIVVSSLTAGRPIMVENANYVMLRTLGQETIGAFADEGGAGALAARAGAGGASGGKRLELLRSWLGRSRSMQR